MRNTLKKSFKHGNLPLPPSKKNCLSSHAWMQRLNVNDLLETAGIGEAPLLGMAGGIATEDAIRSLK